MGTTETITIPAKQIHSCDRLHLEGIATRIAQMRLDA